MNMALEKPQNEQPKHKKTAGIPVKEKEKKLILTEPSR